MRTIAEMTVFIMAAASSRSARGIRQEARDAGQSLFRFRMQHVENRADQQRMAGLFPVIAPFERSFRIDQDVGDVLGIANFVSPRRTSSNGL